MTGDEMLIVILAVFAALPVLLGVRCAWSLKSSRYGWVLAVSALLCGISVHAFYEMIVLGMYPVVLPLILYPTGWLLATAVAAHGFRRLWRARIRSDVDNGTGSRT